MSGKDFYLYIDGKPVRVSEEVYREYHRGAEKERYFMSRLKKGRVVIDPDTKEEHYVPGRERSYERMLELGWQFEAVDASVEDAVVKTQLLEKLRTVLPMLTDQEMGLVEELFYLERTEREAAKRFAVSQNAIHHRKNRILSKLRRLIEK